MPEIHVALPHNPSMERALVRWRALALTLGCLGCGAGSQPGAGADGNIALDPSACTASWRVAYQAEPGEAAPGRQDLVWRTPTLFAGHTSDGFAISRVFSVPIDGASKNVLHEGPVRGFWLEDDQALYAENFQLFDMPVGGGPSTSLFQYGRLTSDQSDIGNHQLDRDAIYWTHSDISLVTTFWKHLRTGGQDVMLASLSHEERQLQTRGFIQSVRDQILYAASSDIGAEPLVFTIAKSDGARRTLPAPPRPLPEQQAAIPLAVSADGVILWTRDDSRRALGPFSFHTSRIDGLPPSVFSTTADPGVFPLAAWPVGNGDWYLGTSEPSPKGDEGFYLSVWFVKSDGTAKRLACDPAVRYYMAHPPSLRNEASFVSGIAIDGHFYVAVVAQANILVQNPSWVLVDVANPGSRGETVDTGTPGDGGPSITADAGGADANGQ
jgi:hypothetical protein